MIAAVYMFFTIFVNGESYTYSIDKSPLTMLECQKELTELLNTDTRYTAIQPEYMTGWCQYEPLGTLEMKPTVETKPEFLK